MMKTRIQIVLLITALLFGAWGLGLVLAPEYSQRLISSEPYNSVMGYLLGCSFLGWVAACIIAMYVPGRAIVLAVAIGTLVMAVVSLVLMFGFHTMPMRDTNLVSLVVALGSSGYLLFAENLISRMQASRRTAKRKPSRTGTKKKKKKAAGKRARSRAATTAGPRRKKKISR
jgi:hypothetical protein